MYMRTYEDYKAILELSQLGYNKSQISKKLSIPRPTVRDVIKRYPAGVAQLEEARVLKTLQCEFESRPRYHFSNYTEEDLRLTISTSINLRETLVKLGIVPAGGNYKTLKDKIKTLEIDTSHFLGCRSNLGKKHSHSNKKPLSLILVEHCNYSSSRLKNRLLLEGYKERRCENCNLTTWNSKDIPLELHHANGNNLDNRLENLQLLCCNCHAQTENYRGRKLSKSYNKEGSNGIY